MLKKPTNIASVDLDCPHNHHYPQLEPDVTYKISLIKDPSNRHKNKTGQHFKGI